MGDQPPTAPTRPYTRKSPRVSPELEPYSVSDVMTLTGWSRTTVIRRFEREKDVLMLDRPETVHKRRYRSFRIPRHVYRRVVRSHGSDDLQPYTPAIEGQMSKQEKFLWAVQTVILANARERTSQPDRPRKYPRLVLDSGVSLIARKALLASERIPPAMTAANAANDFCLFILDDLGVQERLPLWLRRLC